MATRRKPALTSMVRLAISISDGSVERDDEGVPTAFRIFRMGLNESEKGQFLFDAESATAVMAAYQKHGKPLLFDFNHGTTLFDPTPEQGIAAGRFVPEVRADGLWAVVDFWTERARAMLRAKEYQLFSPYFESEGKTGRILRLVNCALTNLPALDNIEPLVAASAKEDPMECAACEALKAQLNKANEEIGGLKVKLSGLEQQEPQARAAIALRANVLQLAEKDTDAAALGALTALKEKAARTDALEAAVEKANTVALSVKWGSYLDGLSTNGQDGKFLPPDSRKKAEALALKVGGGKLTEEGIEGAKEYVALMLVPGQKEPTKQPGGGDAGGGGSSTEDDRHLNRLTGIGDEAAFQKWKEKQPARAAR